MNSDATLKHPFFVVVMLMQLKKSDKSVMIRWPSFGVLSPSSLFDEPMIFSPNTVSKTPSFSCTLLTIAMLLVPVKFEHVVFTKLAPLQKSIYDVFLTSPDIKRLLRGQGSQPLKVCMPSMILDPYLQ